MEIPQPLVDAVLGGRCVAFVGAGFSAPVVPTWADLLRGIAGGDARVDALLEKIGPSALRNAACDRDFTNLRLPLWLSPVALRFASE